MARKYTTGQIGLMLQSARTAAKATQQEIADAAGLTKNHISKIERGVAKPSVETLLAYCKVLGLSPDEILDYHGDRINPELIDTLKTYTSKEQEKLSRALRAYKS